MNVLLVKKSSNWNLLKKKGYGNTAATRDVEGQQILERGEREQLSNPWPRRIAAGFLAVILGLLGYALGFGFLFLRQFVGVFTSGQSWMEFTPETESIFASRGLVVFALFAALLSGLVMYERFMANWKSENSMADTTDINPHMNDQHVMLTEEMQEKLDWFPDAGAHSGIQVSSMLSHVMLSNKGLKRVDMAERYKEDSVDDKGVKHYKGEIIRNEDGDAVLKKQPLIDEDFGQELLTASGIPQSKETKDIRTPYDVRKIQYNPPIEGDEKKEKPQRIDRDKMDYDTVADLINADWEIPEYEVQRPAGAYLVDTAPVNTMVLAITRAGKGGLARFV